MRGDASVSAGCRSLPPLSKSSCREPVRVLLSLSLTTRQTARFSALQIGAGPFGRFARRNGRFDRAGDFRPCPSARPDPDVDAS